MASKLDNLKNGSNSVFSPVDWFNFGACNHTTGAISMWKGIRLVVGVSLIPTGRCRLRWAHLGGAVAS